MKQCECGATEGLTTQDDHTACDFCWSESESVSNFDYCILCNNPIFLLRTHKDGDDIGCPCGSKGTWIIDDVIAIDWDCVQPNERKGIP